MSAEQDRDRPETAAEWFVRLDATAPDAAGDAQLAEWLARSPDNEASLARCASAIAVARRLADDPELRAAYAEATDLARGGPAAAAPSARRPAVLGLGVAALAAMIALAALHDRGPTDAAAPSPPPRGSRAAAIVANASAENSAVMLPGRVVVDANSLAVLPFAAARGPGAAGSDDLAAQLESLVVTELSTVPGIYVVSGAAVLPFADGEFSAAEIGVLLGARGIMSGTVERLEGRVRVRAQLSDAATDRVVWSVDYERPTDDLRAIQLDLVDGVAAALVDPALRHASAGLARGENALASAPEPSFTE
jgi:TolB-like protein